MALLLKLKTFYKTNQRTRNLLVSVIHERTTGQALVVEKLRYKQQGQTIFYNLAFFKDIYFRLQLFEL